MRRFVSTIPDDLAIEKSRSLLQMARGVSLDAHSGFEQILMEVFCHLLGTNLAVAGIIFFRLTSAGLRNRTIEDLIAKKHGNKFDAYWFGTKTAPGLLTLIKQVDNKRNEIVHWKPIFEPKVGEFVLRPPNLWNAKPNSPYNTIDDVFEHIAKTDCMRHFAGNFNWFTCHYEAGQTSAHALAWRDKFDQPPSYPPPEDHPLYKMWSERRIRPKSSEA